MTKDVLLKLGIAIAVTIGQILLSNIRSSRYNFLGGIIPLGTLGIGMFVAGIGKLDKSFWGFVLVSLLIWLDGLRKSKYRELQKMRAKDLT
jgi:hypothetical protein